MAIKGISGQSAIERFERITPLKANESQKQLIVTTARNQSISSDKKVPDFRIDLKKYQLNNQIAQRQTPQNQLGNLKEGDKIPVTIGEKDTQSDILKKAYTEFAEQAGLSDSEGFAAKMVKDGDQIYHQNTNTAFTSNEFEANRAAGSINIIPTASDITALRQAKISELTSYGLFDWSVTSNEQKQVFEILKNDPNLSRTIQGLEKDDALGDLISRVDNTENRRELIDLLLQNASKSYALSAQDFSLLPLKSV